MIIIDPLKYKIQDLLVEGQSNPLNQARQRFGTQNDINLILDKYTNQQVSDRRYIYIDLTPFERIGRINLLVSELAKHKKIRPVLMIISEDIIFKLESEFDNIPILIVQFSQNGDLKRIIGDDSSYDSLVKKIERDIKHNGKGSELIKLRRVVTEKNLTELLFEKNCLDIPTDIDNNNTAYISGRFYRKMPNNMLVSSYLNLKEIGKNYTGLTTLAYEIILELMLHFRRDKDPFNSFDVLVTPNNTSLFLTSTVQAILGKPVISIDRLGPIPALQLNSGKLSKALSGKRVIVIEEVVATGNEVDRTILFLSHIKAELKKIISLYNLEVGMPMLLKPGQMISLCKPKDELKYVYRSY